MKTAFLNVQKREIDAQIYINIAIEDLQKH